MLINSTRLTVNKENPMTNFILLLISLLFCQNLHSKPVIIAHRGASSYLPEHTLPGVSLAYGLGADFIEADLVLTKDGQLVVLHDIFLEYTSNVASLFPARKRSDGHWYAIDFTLNEIKEMHVYERKNSQNINEQKYKQRFSNIGKIFKVPTFDEFIMLVDGLNKTLKKNVGIYPEIKRPKFHEFEGYDITDLFMKKIFEYQNKKMLPQTFIQCFEPETLKKIYYEYRPSIPLIQLIDENNWQTLGLDKNMVKALQEIKSYSVGIGPSLNNILFKDHDQMIKKTLLAQFAQSEKLLLHPWTARKDDLPTWAVSFDDLIEKLVKNSQIDGIFTDFTDLTKSLIEAYTSSK